MVLAKQDIPGCPIHLLAFQKFIKSEEKRFLRQNYCHPERFVLVKKKKIVKLLVDRGCLNIEFTQFLGKPRLFACKFLHTFISFFLFIYAL